MRVLIGRSLRWKFNFLILLSLTGFGLALGYLAWEMRVLTRDFQMFTQTGVEVRTHILAIARDQGSCARLARNAILGDDHDQTLAQFNDLLKGIGTHFDALAQAADRVKGPERNRFAALIAAAKGDTMAYQRESLQRISSLPSNPEPRLTAATWSAWKSQVTPIANQARAAQDVGRQAEGVRVDSAQVATATQEQAATVEEVTRTSHELARCAEVLNTQTVAFCL